MTQYRDTLGMEYVYISESTQEYKKIQVNLILGDDETDIYTRPEQMINCGELNSVLEYMKGDILKKLQIDVSADCHVYVVHGGITYTVELENGKAQTITELNPS
jgi:hypothetical protein